MNRFFPRWITSERDWILIDSTTDSPGILEGPGGRHIPLDELSTSMRLRLKRGERCCAIMPGRFCMLRPLRLPAAAGRRRSRLLPGVLDLEIPFPVEECQTLFLNAEADQFGTALALTVRRHDLETVHHQLRSNDCNPEWLIPEPLLFWHGFRRLALTASGTKIPVVHIVHGNRASVLAGDDKGQLQRFVAGMASDGSLLARSINGINLRTDDAAVYAITDCNNTDWMTAIPLPAIRLDIAPSSLWHSGLMFATRHTALNLNHGDYRHPLHDRRMATVRTRTAWSMTVAALVLAVIHGHALRKTEIENHRVSKIFSNHANELAGYRITRPGDEALAAVRTAMEARIPDAFRSWMQPDIHDSLLPWLRLASNMQIRIHTLNGQTHRWQMRATAPTASDARLFAEQSAAYLPNLEFRGVPINAATQGYRFALDAGTEP